MSRGIPLLSLFLTLSLTACRNDQFFQHDRFQWSFEPALELNHFSYKPCEEERACQYLEIQITLIRSDVSDRAPYEASWSLPEFVTSKELKWLGENTLIMTAEIPNDDFDFHSSTKSYLILKRGDREKYFEIALSPSSQTLTVNSVGSDEPLEARRDQLGYVFNTDTLTVRGTNPHRASILTDQLDLQFEIINSGFPAGYPLSIQLTSPQTVDLGMAAIGEAQSLRFSLPWTLSHFEPDGTLFLTFDVQPQRGSSLLWLVALSFSRDHPPSIVYNRVVTNDPTDSQIDLPPAAPLHIYELSFDNPQWPGDQASVLPLRVRHRSQLVGGTEKAMPLMRLNLQGSYVTSKQAEPDQIERFLLTTTQESKLLIPLKYPSLGRILLRVDVVDLRRTDPSFLLIDLENRRLDILTRDFVSHYYPILLQ